MIRSSIRILKNEDAKTLEAFLSSRIESSMFLIGNMRAAGLSDQGKTYEGTYAAAFKNEQIVGVVAHYWNQNIILQAPIQLNELCTAAFEGSQRAVKGILGPNDQVNAAKKLFRIDDSSVQLDQTEKLYSLKLEDLIVPENLASDRVKGRQIESRDIDLISKWRVEYSIEALGEKDSRQLQMECRSAIERSMKEKHTWVLEENGKPIACTSFNTAITEAVQVGGVWTPPELRGRGFGRAVVATSLIDARNQGVDKAILFTGENNKPAQIAYEALGFQHIGDYRILFLKSSITHNA